MKYIYIVFIAILVCSCSNKTKMAEAAKKDSLSAVYSINVADKNGVHVLDSLHRHKDLGSLMKLHYRGIIDFPAGRESECNMMIYRYQNSIDGVYVMLLKDLKTNEKHLNKGRLNSITAGSINIDATVYQLHPFKRGQIMEFLFTQDFLQFIANTPQNPQESSKNLLTLQNRPPCMKLNPHRHDERSIWH
jgi:hypothetical protein